MGRMPMHLVMFLPSCSAFWGHWKLSGEKRNHPFWMKLGQNKSEIMLTGRRENFQVVKRKVTSLETVAVPALN